MRRRVLPLMVVSFLAGMAVAYGLVYLDRQARIPRFQSTDIFEVVTPDGAVERLSYADVDEERRELGRLRKQLRELQRIAVYRQGKRGDTRLASPPGATSLTGLPPRQEEGAGAQEPGKGPRGGGAEKLRTLFARIFSEPLMKELRQAQIRRKVGELAAVLDLTEEQEKAVAEALEQGTPGFPDGPPKRGIKGRAEPSQRSLEETLTETLSAEQYERYQEYTEKKSALSQSPLLDREIFELTWRLGLTEEQQAPVREILQEQGEKLRDLALSPPGTESGGEGRPGLAERLEARLALRKETAERMKSVLDEDQYSAFLEYQEQKDAQTRLLERLLHEETRPGPAGPTP